LEVRGNSFDGVDRTTQKFEHASGGTAELTNNYDATPSTIGLLYKTTDAVGGSTTYSYDSAQRITEKLYGDPSTTSTEDYAYDLLGHVASNTSSLFGAESYVYEARRIAPSRWL
jgi:YD repeat-containing protein